MVTRIIILLACLLSQASAVSALVAEAPMPPSNPVDSAERRAMPDPSEEPPFPDPDSKQIIIPSEAPPPPTPLWDIMQWPVPYPEPTWYRDPEVKILIVFTSLLGLYILISEYRSIKVWWNAFTWKDALRVLWKIGIVVVVAVIFQLIYSWVMSGMS